MISRILFCRRKLECQCYACMYNTVENVDASVFKFFLLKEKEISSAHFMFDRSLKFYWVSSSVERNCDTEKGTFYTV